MCGGKRRVRDASSDEGRGRWPSCRQLGSDLQEPEKSGLVNSKRLEREVSTSLSSSISFKLLWMATSDKMRCGAIPHPLLV